MSPSARSTSCVAILRPGGRAEPVLSRLGLDPAQVRARLEASGRKGKPRGGGDEPAHTSHAKRLIDNASKEAREAGSELTSDHLLLAALHEPRGVMARILSDAGVSPERVRAELHGPAPASARRQDQPTRVAVETGHPTRERAAPSDHTGLPPHLRKSRQPRWRLLLLAAVPVSILLGYVVHAPAVWVFGTACPGVLPLAGYMGDATERLAHRTGPTVGGLLNATFGNAAELIIALMALRAGLVDLVKASITGSILGNLLLIMGLAIVAGGLNRSELKFNRTNAGMSAGMLALVEVLALGMATGVTAIITLDGESHWFEGVQLLAVYLMVAVGAFFL